MGRAVQRVWLNPAHGPAVGRFARERPLVWLDDDFDLFPTARRAFLDRRRDPTALIAVDPATGITADHLAAVEVALRS
ncbi:hypothetical protein ADK67_35500 [Saccharothrix sp. NRRL B-16348]|nr:hypothetical protein ADK67_35500 [Saccharothrix sp. NRRL B-16348]